MTDPRDASIDTLERLSNLLLNGELDEAQMGQLESMLRGNGEAQDVLLGFCQIHTDLCFSLRADRAFEKALSMRSQRIEREAGLPSITPAPLRTDSTGRRQYWQRHPVSFLGIVSALTVLLGFGFFLIWSGPFAGPAPLVGPNVPRPSVHGEVVAEVTGAFEPVWDPTSDVGKREQTLRPGQRVVLQRGVAEVEFASGAVILLEGPAEFQADDGNGGRLLVGRLSAKIPPSAHGFTVQSDNIRVVDLGTEFGLAIDASGAGQVAVFDGKVQVAPARARRFAARELVAGQALTLGPQGRLRSITTNSVSARPFIRQLPRSQTLPTRTAVFQQGAPDPFTGQLYDGCEDTMLIAWGSHRNFGARKDFDVGNAEEKLSGRALIRFDLSSMAGRYRYVRSVTLRLIPSDAYYSPLGSGTVQMFRMHDANADWSEGEFNGGDKPATGVATWAYRQQGQTRWAGSAGAGTAGVDYFAPALAKRSYDRTLAAGEPFDLRMTGSLGIVVQWISRGANAGFLLRNQVEDSANRVNFHSAEAEEVGVRPQLVVEYVPLPDPSETPRAAQ